MKELHILLIDKNLSYVEIAKKMLKFHDESYNIDVATTGNECFQKLDETSYELILLDYNVDNNGGLRVLNKIIQAGFDIPVIMLLDENKEEVAFQALELGASDYIIKVRGYLTALPFTVGKVLEQFKLNGNKNITIPVSPQAPPALEKSSSSEEIFFILDHRCHFISANKKIEKMLEYSEAEILELAFHDLIPREDETKYTQWLTSLNLRNARIKSFKTKLIGKYGKKHEVEIYLDPVQKQDGIVSTYKGKIIILQDSDKTKLNLNNVFNQGRMLSEMLDIINASSEDSFSHLLNRITNTICHIFRFKRATLALLDSRRDVFIKQTMIGFNGQTSKNYIQEVPRNIIEKAFEDQYKVRVMYFDENLEITSDSTYWQTEERRGQPRRIDKKWHPKDLIILNLKDQKKQTFGYISLDNPEFNAIPSRELFYNLELCADMASLAIQNYYRYNALEKRNRRLMKQLLNTSNLFRIDQNIYDILHEFVWSIKFSLEFNLVLIGVISVNSGKIEVKATACDDKIKTLQLKELKFSIDSFRMLTQKQYKNGKSFYINKKEPMLKPIKDIYYRNDHQVSVDVNYWPWWAMLLIPIRSSQENKIMGFLMLDDPVDCLQPSNETIHTLEILTTQISVAIENKQSYLKIKEDIHHNTQSRHDFVNHGSFKKFVDRIFK